MEIATGITGTTGTPGSTCITGTTGTTGTTDTTGTTGTSIIFLPSFLPPSLPSLPSRDGDAGSFLIGQSNSPTDRSTGEESNMNWCGSGPGLFVADLRDNGGDCDSCRGSETSFRHTSSSANLLAAGQGRRGVLNMPILVDSGFLSRSDCSILINETLFDVFFAHLQVQVSAPPTTILTANGASLPLSLTFQGSLSINGPFSFIPLFF